MTAKEFVKEKMPKARAERQVQGRVKGMTKAYYLIRDGRASMYFAQGKTESAAWVAARKRIQEIESK